MKHFLLIGAAACVLSACGGGGSDGSAAPATASGSSGEPTVGAAPGSASAAGQASAFMSEIVALLRGNSDSADPAPVSATAVPAEDSSEPIAVQ